MCHSERIRDEFDGYYALYKSTHLPFYRDMESLQFGLSAGAQRIPNDRAAGQGRRQEAKPREVDSF